MSTTPPAAPARTRTPDGRPTPPAPPRLRLQPGWLLTAIFMGVPLWWVLGITEIVYFSLAVPMLIFLMRLRKVAAPRGIGLWLLFLVWLWSAVFVMQVDAPGAQPGASNLRYLTFSYRFGWYTVATVAMLYVTNTRHFLSTQRISWAISWLFVALVAGGLLGVAFPRLEFPSALELLLPRGLSNNGFVASLVHPRVAQVQTFLGYEAPRPTAPFYFANQWGANLVVTIPHFIIAWWQRGGRWRIAMPLVLCVAAVPIVSSLNRAMWGALIAMALYAVVQLARRGHVQAFVAFAGALLLAAVTVAMSPLGDVVVDRFNTPHSNEGRANLGTLTAQSTWDGSPFIGYGTTRDVAGNFTSIAGGESEQCPACSPPPLGTQGQLWLLIFGSGFVGAALYVAFFAGRLLQHNRDRSIYSLGAQCTVVGLFVTMPFYTAVHSALVVGLMSIGIMHREAPPDRHELAAVVAPARRCLPMVIACAVIGGVAGAAYQTHAGIPATATQRILVPNELQIGGLETRPLSMDSEALIARSTPVLQAVAQATGSSSRAEVSSHLSISARPNSRILLLSYTHPDPATAQAGAAAAASSLVGTRAALEVASQQDRVQLLDTRQRGLAHVLGLADELDDATGPGASPALDATSAQVRNLSRSLAAEISAEGPRGTSGARVLDGTAPVQPSDPWLVSVGSGGMLGLAGGLAMARYLDGRATRLRRMPERRLGVPLPVIELVPDGRSLTTTGAAAARHVAGIYAPLAAVVADPRDADSRWLADHMEQASGRSGGDRVLLVASTRSRPRDVREVYEQVARSGAQPIGLVLIDPDADRPTRHRSTFNTTGRGD